MNDSDIFRGDNEGFNAGDEEVPREAVDSEEPSPEEYRLAPADDEPVIAEVVVENAGTQAIHPAINHQRTWVSPLNSLPVDVAREFQNMSAVGGAVGSLVLGVWSIICSTITPFGAVNAIIALLLGIWGLSSRRKRLAMAGIGLGLTGLFLCLFEFNEMLSIWLSRDESA